MSIRTLTQEDPIGLAGGLNLYGFAGGDPINFSDPVGLCPQWLTGRPCGNILDGSAMQTRTSATDSMIGRFGMTHNGGAKAHQGWDVLATAGSDVTAADMGDVDRIGYSEGLGNYVQIAHFNGYGDVASYTMYAHLESVADGLQEGATVSAGDVVGTAGNTGNAANTPTHVHFEIRTESFPGFGVKNRLDPQGGYRKACGERCQ